LKKLFKSLKMSVQAITSVFEVLHTRAIKSLHLSRSGGDLLLAVAFSILCEFLKRICNSANPKLGYGEVEKFQEVLYKIILRIWFTYYSITLCLSKDYFWDPTLFYRQADGRLRDNNCTRQIALDERIYYVTLFGYYLNHTLTQFSDPKRKDFWALCAHHIITLCLLLLSYKSGYSSIGVVLAMCHEPSDLLLALAKLFRYLGMKMVTDAFFIVFTLSWIYFRIYLYPLKCLVVSATGPWRFGYHDFLPVHVDDPPNCWCRMGTVLLTLMLTLYILHLYWTVFLVKAVLRKIKTGMTEDTRSDKEERIEGGPKED